MKDTPADTTSVSELTQCVTVSQWPIGLVIAGHSGNLGIRLIDIYLSTMGRKVCQTEEDAGHLVQ